MSEFSKKMRRGSFYWTKRREILENTSAQMKYVREWLNKNNEFLTKRPITLITDVEALHNIHELDSSKESAPKKFHIENHTLSGTDVIETAEYSETEEFGPQYEEITEQHLNHDIWDAVSLNSTAVSSVSHNHYENFHSDSLRQKLAEWAIKFNIAQAAVKTLLAILKPLAPKLPDDPRTLLSTPKSYDSKKVGDGYYHHFGISTGIQSLVKNGLLILPDSGVLNLQINIDGLPVHKSSKSQLWLILSKVRTSQFLDPFVIGVF